MTEVHGTTAPGFERTREVMAGNIASGADLGASFAVTHRGEMVVDIWGGWADIAKTKH